MSEKKSKTSGEGNAPRITAGNQQDSQPARSLDAALRGRIIGPKRQTGGEESDTASDAPHEDAGVGESQAHQPEAPWWGEDQRPSMTIALSCYRKAYPQEILFQLEPVLRKIGIRWWEIIGLFQEYLRQKGFEVFEVDPGWPDGYETDEIHFLHITNEKVPSIDPKLGPRAQIVRPSELIRQADGSCVQGFHLHLDPWGGHEPVETLFVPDDGCLHSGDLVKCEKSGTNVSGRRQARGVTS